MPIHLLCCVAGVHLCATEEGDSDSAASWMRVAAAALPPPAAAARAALLLAAVCHAPAAVGASLTHACGFPH